jgi:hypothetical protein
MPTPGLPLPPGMANSANGSYRLTSRESRRTSKDLKAVLTGNTLTPTVKKRILWGLAILVVFLLGSNYGYKKAQVPKPPFAVDTLPPPDNPPTGFSITHERKIPPIVHYVHGLSKDFGGKPFGFAQFVAVNSMFDNLHPDKVMVWYKYEPQGWWWNKAKEYAAKKGIVWEMKEARDVEEVL